MKLHLSPQGSVGGEGCLHTAHDLHIRTGTEIWAEPAVFNKAGLNLPQNSREKVGLQGGIAGGLIVADQNE